MCEKGRKKRKKDFVDRKKRSIFASQFERGTRCSAVRLAHLVWDQRVGGSNPFTSTEKRKSITASFFRYVTLLSMLMSISGMWATRNFADLLWE